MLIFLNDDKPYLYWVTHHRQGYVIAGRQKPKLRHLTLHRATCTKVRTAASKRTHWTSGGRLMACSLNRAELEAWAKEETGKDLEACLACQPGEELPDDLDKALHLTRLGSEILDYVLDAALIHFEELDPPYHLTVSDIATCMGKTSGQISQVLHRLVAKGVLAVHGKYASHAAISPRRIVVPTIKGIKIISMFADEDDEYIAQELAKLLPES